MSAKRRAFPRHAPGSNAAALQALEQMRQSNAAPEPSQPQASAVRHTQVLYFLNVQSLYRCTFVFVCTERFAVPADV